LLESVREDVLPNAHGLGVPARPSGGAPLQVHPSQLLVGREDLLRGLGELVAAQSEFPLIVALEGPRGAGTSAVAAELVGQARRKLMQAYRDARPVVIHVDVSSLSQPSGDPTHGISVSLLRHFMPGESFQGASTNRVMWWFLRRLIVEGKSAVLWLDQVRQDVRSLSSVIEPLMNPETLVESAEKFPSIVIVLSGNGDGGLDGCVKRIRVSPLPVGSICEIMEDKVRQAGKVLSEEARAKVVDVLGTRGYSLSVMESVLNSAVQRAGCHGIIMEEDVVPPSFRNCPRTSKRVIELRVLEILRKAGGAVEMGELAQELSRSLASEGERIMSPSSVRRWLIKLEGLGLVKRRVVMGGDGGTRSTVAMVEPRFVHRHFTR